MTSSVNLRPKQSHQFVPLLLYSPLVTSDELSFIMLGHQINQDRLHTV